MPKYQCFCNECGHKKVTDTPMEFEFCPVCRHVNTGYVRMREDAYEEPKPKPTRKLPEVQVYRSMEKTPKARELAELSRKLYYRFVEANKVISARPCYNWVKLGKPKYNKIDGRYKPFLDHATLFICEGERKLLVSQPYVLNEKDTNDVIKWAGQRGLKVDIDENSSWYFPGRTVLLTFEIKNLDTFEAYLEKNARNSSIGFGMQEVE